MFKKALVLIAVFCVFCVSMTGCASKKASPEKTTLETFQVFSVEQDRESVIVTALDENLKRLEFLIPTEKCYFSIQKNDQYDVMVLDPTVDKQERGYLYLNRERFDSFKELDIDINLELTHNIPVFELTGIKNLSPEIRYKKGYENKYLLEINFLDFQTKKPLTNRMVWTYIYEKGEESTESVTFLPKNDQTKLDSDIAVAFVHKSRIEKAFK